MRRLAVALSVTLTLHNPASACDAGNFKVGIDIGHTLESPGATSARGVPEHEFNVKLANLIASKLKDAGFSRTTLLSARGVGNPQLASRVSQANALGLDLYLSVHHDSVQRVYLTPWSYAGTVHTYSDRFRGYSLFISMQNPAAEKSLLFARLLGQELNGSKLHASNHHAENIAGEHRQLLDPGLGIYRYDDLVVLRSNKAPAVLLEAGIIVNREEELQLAGAERQGVIAQAIVRAVTRFCRRDPPDSFMPHD